MIDDRSSSLESPRGTGRSVSELRVRSEPIPLSWMEASVPVRTECDQFPMSQMSHSGPYISTIPQGRYEAVELVLSDAASLGGVGAVGGGDEAQRKSLLVAHIDGRVCGPNFTRTELVELEHFPWHFCSIMFSDFRY
jgi:hypothetical protein